MAMIIAVFRYLFADAPKIMYVAIRSVHAFSAIHKKIMIISIYIGFCNGDAFHFVRERN